MQMMPSCDHRVGSLDQLAHPAEGFPAPVPEFGDSVRDELRRRLALARARFFHARILEVPDTSFLYCNRVLLCIRHNQGHSPRLLSFREKYTKDADKYHLSRVNPALFWSFSIVLIGATTAVVTGGALVDLSSRF